MDGRVTMYTDRPSRSSFFSSPYDRIDPYPWLTDRQKEHILNLEPPVRQSYPDLIIWDERIMDWSWAGGPLHTLNEFYGSDNDDEIDGQVVNNEIGRKFGAWWSFNPDSSLKHEDNQIYARQGNDIVHGSTRSEDIKGEEGNDTLNGGGGDDTLNGSLDQLKGVNEIDVLTGGSGADLFVLADKDNYLIVRSNKIR